MQNNIFDNLEEKEKELNKQKEELLKDFRKRKKNCCLGCLTPIIFIIVAFIASSIYVMKIPAFKPLLTCVQNQYEIYQAIQRYKDLNNKYPKKLTEISKDYLKDENIIYCPLDNKKESYDYNPNSDSDYIIKCSRHKLDQNQPKIIIYIDKFGQFREKIENKK